MDDIFRANIVQEKFLEIFGYAIVTAMVGIIVLLRLVQGGSWKGGDNPGFLEFFDSKTYAYSI